MIPIPATERKLAEARHFFERLLDTANRVGAAERAMERYNLSAFLNAASSIRWVLQKEAKAEYDAWQPEWFAGLTDSDRQLLKTMTQQRNLETKQDGATVSVRASMQMRWQPKNARPATPHVPQTVGSGPYGSQMLGNEFYGAGMMGSGPHVSLMFGYGSYGEFVTFEEETLILKLNGEAHYVLALCEEYLKLLERLVRDFKAAHA